MILGIDIGGTSIKIGIVSKNKIKKQYKIKTNKTTIIMDIINSFNEHKINIDKLEAIGIAVPGFINHKKGIVKKSGNLNWDNFHFKKEFEKELNTEVFIINDANAAALGEYSMVKNEYESIIFYTLGTGIGGGIIINGNLIFGSKGYAGELGHGGNFQSKTPCTCGLKNCIEPVSSATGIEKELTKFFNKKTTILDVKDDLKNGDKAIIDIFNESLKPLAAHISTMETAINPDAIIIGGGPSNLGKPLINLIRELVSDIQLDFIHDETPILIAQTKNNAGILGAAYWARQNKK